MTFLLKPKTLDIHELERRWREYSEYIKSHRGTLSQSLYEFALATWHYDPNDHRSLHDSWLLEVSITSPIESRLGTQSVKIGLLGAYHDCVINLNYDQVASWTIARSPTDYLEWDCDEFIIRPDGLIEHAIRWSNGIVWNICFCDLSISIENVMAKS